MAEQVDVQFEQLNSLQNIFGSDNDSAINQFIGGLQTFGNNVQFLTETLVNFLEYSKFILQALRDPLALALIPLLDALIAELEDLKNIGLGSLTVWPWECGTLAAPVDTSKLEEGLDALAFYLLPDSDKKNSELVWNPNTGYGLLERKNNDKKSKLSRLDDAISAPQSSNLKQIGNLGESKNALLDMTESLREFLDPTTWTGDFDQAVAEVLKGLKFALNKRQLTPAEVISKIQESFNDPNDQLKPTGKGTYEAMVLLFALPSFSDLNQLLSAFYDYFGGVLTRSFKEGKEEVETSTKKIEIELGQPLTFDVDTVFDLSKLVTQKQNELDSLLAISEPSEDEREEIEELREEIRELEEDINDLKNNGGKSADSIFFTNSVKINHSLLRDDNNVPITFRPTQQKPVPDDFPVFKKGDLIVQGRSPFVGPNFEAEVIKHGPIQIENGKIIRNSLTVKEVSGKITENRSTRGVGSSGVIRRKNILEDDVQKQTLKSGGPGAEAVLRTIPMYQPAGSEIPKPVPADVKFIGTIEEGDNLIDNVLPASLKGEKAQTALDAILQDARSGSPAENAIGSFQKTGPGKEYTRPLDRLRDIEGEMTVFLDSLSIGLVVRHPFLNTGEWTLPETMGEELSSFGGNLKKLASAFPGFGVNYHIGEIFIKDSETSKVKPFIPGRARQMLFERDENNNIVKMNIIQIKLGRLVSDGSYDVSTGPLSLFIQVPGQKKEFYDFNQIDGNTNQTIEPFETFKFSGGLPPNWKFIRVQDFLPVYGTFLDEAISFVEKGKKFVNSGLKIIDTIIDRLQKEIDAIIKFNKQVQQLIRILSQGFNGAGFYMLQVSGVGGPSDFKKKLGRAKFLQKEVHAFDEISLETIKKDREVTNPVTGLKETISVTTMAPVVRKRDLENPNNQPKLLNASDLDGLKYSGAIVFYGQANDPQGYSTWKKQADAVGSLFQSLIGNTLGTGDTFAEKLRPEIVEVQVQDTEGNFFNSEDTTKLAKFDTNIRIKIKNSAHELTEEERQVFSDVQGREIDFSPTILTSTLNVTNSDDQINTLTDVFCLYKGENPNDTNCIQLENAFVTSLNETGETQNGFSIQEFFIDLKLKNGQTLPASGDDEPTYKLRVKSSPLSRERLSLRGLQPDPLDPNTDLSFVSTNGFKISKTSIISLELNNAI